MGSNINITELPEKRDRTITDCAGSGHAPERTYDIQDSLPTLPLHREYISFLMDEWSQQYDLTPSRLRSSEVQDVPGVTLWTFPLSWNLHHPNAMKASQR
jgi:hypothetical protein